MRILITNIVLSGRSGTETYVRDLALELLRRQHEVAVFTPRLGPIAEELIAAGIEVAARLDNLRLRPDIIHGHHNLQTALAMLHFPDIPAIFVCHDSKAWHDSPPLLTRIRH